MKIKLTKKAKIILFVILGIVVLGSGGFLLWRVLQTDTVAPEDSDAGGNDTGSCYNTCTCNVCKSTSGSYTPVPLSGQCPSGQTKVSSCTEYNKLPLTNCYRHDCGHGVWIYSTIQSSSQACKDCSWDEEDTSGECDFGSTCPTCRWPNVAFCDNNQNGGTCICKRWDSFDNPGCNYGDNFNCNAVCPSGQVECSSGETGCTEVRKNCICPECDNKTYDTTLCKTPTEQNLCEGSGWVEKPSGTYESCNDITATIKSTDVDGIGADSISVKVNGQSKTTYTTSTSTQDASTTQPTRITYDFSEADCTQPGEYTISFDWKDSKGNSGPDCTLSTSFTIAQEDEPYCGDGIKQSDEICDPEAQGEDSQCTNNLGETVDCSNDCTCPQEQQNPDWTIVKTAVGQCIEGEPTYAKATYTITVTNTGEGEGTIDKVEDQLDEKVLESYLNEISNSGVYSSGVIIWDLEGEDETFSPEESMQFTYYIQVPVDSFGIYQNTVTAYPTEGEDFSDSEDVNLTCDIPQTGLFDTVLSKVLLGLIFILIGANWNSITKVNFTIKELVADQRIKTFEKRLRKDKS